MRSFSERALILVASLIFLSVVYLARHALSTIPVEPSPLTTTSAAPDDANPAGPGFPRL
jgi:hypothetical protein